jgi:uncharacterized membrane protein YkoI
MTMTTRNKKLILAGVALVALAIGGTAIAAVASSDSAAEGDEGVYDDDATERSIGGSDLEKASAAALEHTGGGEVTATEVEDEESYYEVEVTLDDGSQVDVQLDRNFEVVGDESDAD